MFRKKRRKALVLPLLLCETDEKGEQLPLTLVAGAMRCLSSWLLVSSPSSPLHDLRLDLHISTVATYKTYTLG